LYRLHDSAAGRAIRSIAMARDEEDADRQILRRALAQDEE
jgi:hypothetical protein